MDFIVLAGVALLGVMGLDVWSSLRRGATPTLAAPAPIGYLSVPGLEVPITEVRLSRAAVYLVGEGPLSGYAGGPVTVLQADKSLAWLSTTAIGDMRGYPGDSAKITYKLDLPTMLVSDGEVDT